MFVILYTRNGSDVWLFARNFDEVRFIVETLKEIGYCYHVFKHVTIDLN